MLCINSPSSEDTPAVWQGACAAPGHVTLVLSCFALLSFAIGSTSFLHVRQRTHEIEASSFSSLISALGAFHSPVCAELHEGRNSLLVILLYLFLIRAQHLGHGRCSERSVALHLSCADDSKI